jgi:hypothetical protein
MNQFRLKAVLRIILRRIGRDFTSLRRKTQGGIAQRIAPADRQAADYAFD